MKWGHRRLNGTYVMLLDVIEYLIFLVSCMCNDCIIAICGCVAMLALDSPGMWMLGSQSRRPHFCRIVF